MTFVAYPFTLLTACRRLLLQNYAKELIPPCIMAAILGSIFALVNGISDVVGFTCGFTKLVRKG